MAEWIFKFLFRRPSPGPRPNAGQARVLEGLMHLLTLGGPL
jgi:hypothetical protein